MDLRLCRCIGVLYFKIRHPHRGPGVTAWQGIKKKKNHSMRHKRVSICLPSATDWTDFYIKSGTLNSSGLRAVVAEFVSASVADVSVEHYSSVDRKYIFVDGRGLDGFQFNMCDLLEYLNLSETDCTITFSYFID